jgi:ABC-type glycerol-3-phosphate transport system substrate-binding protein
MRALAVLAVIVLVLVAAGCGGGNDSSQSSNTTTVAIPKTAQNEAVYERAYTECSSTDLQGLATKYNVTKTVQAITTAVGVGWAKRFGGGLVTAKAGQLGCRDGLRSRPDSSY